MAGKKSKKPSEKAAKKAIKKPAEKKAAKKPSEKAAPEKTLKETQHERFLTAQRYSKELLTDFKRSLKSVIVYGSTAKGKHGEKSDIDVFVIIDDTKLERDIPDEVKERIWADLRRAALKVDKNITIQAFMFLTEFWESIRNVEPLTMEILRAGVPVYDVGVFMPAKRMLQRGKLPTTREAVIKRLHIAPQHIKMARYKLRSVAHTLEQAMASAGQAPLMFIGRVPPGKEAVAQELDHYFVKKGLLDEKWVKVAEELHQFNKEMEHVEKDVPEGLGARADEMIKKCSDFIKEMVRLVQSLEKNKKSNVLLTTYKTFLKANVGALELKGVKPPEKLKDLPAVMAQHFPEVEEQQKTLFEKMGRALVAAKKGEAEMIPEKEIYTLREETKRFILDLGKKLKELKEKGELKIPEKLKEKGLAGGEHVTTKPPAEIPEEAKPEETKAETPAEDKPGEEKG